jgi:putative cardiolipin synthase
MFKHLSYVFLLISLVSCTIQKTEGKPKKEHAGNFPYDQKDIYEALDLQKDTTRTGIYTLEMGGESLFARLWFIDHAKTSIDIQYYSFTKDLSSRLACDHLLHAAMRGIKVRILVDDAADKLSQPMVRLLDSHENIEIRVYNTGLKSGSIIKRIPRLSKNIRRVLKRMHNKLMVVDGEIAILGGRNIGDRYFDLSKTYDFRDRDAVIFGKASTSAEASFNEFWEHTLTVRYDQLSGKIHGKSYKNPLRFKKLPCYVSVNEGLCAVIQKQVDNYPKELKEHVEQKDLFWLEDITFLSDKPGKNDDRQIKKGGLLTDSVVELIKAAKISIDILSPYFILDDEGSELIEKTLQRGIKLRVITNSMASTDNFEAFSGYHRGRKKILLLGIELHEFNPKAPVKKTLMWPGVQLTNNYKAVYGYHPKIILIDGYTTILGSYNFDPRSANLNTECCVVIRSKLFSEYISAFAEKELLSENSWLITDQCNPDNKAGLRKKIKVFTRNILPKKWL